MFGASKRAVKRSVEVARGGTAGGGSDGRGSSAPFAHLKSMREAIVTTAEATAESDPETIAFSKVHCVCSRKRTTAAAFATSESAST